MIAAVDFGAVDWAVLVVYFAGILGLGLAFWRRNNSSDEFTAAGRSLPGWLCGLSIFATFLSSISYLALPGKAFVDNWNAFMFSVALPPAAFIAVRYFVPLYRKSGEVSAYSLLETRFGLWARLCASCFYLLYQIARIGVVMYLMALPMAVLFGWDIRTLIVVTGVIVTAYSFVGGIVAVIWADAVQAVVLLAGALLALWVILSGLQDGPSQAFQIAGDAGKFSLGDMSWSVSESTVWVVFAFGIFDNLRNFGVDQSYVQRYIAAKTDRDAAKSVWVGALLYVPVSALFLFIGSSLFAYYSTHEAELLDVRQIVADQRIMQAGGDPEAAGSDMERDRITAGLTSKDLGDRVFPHFIASHLPVGVRGLLIAAIFAAAMSTVSTSLNSSATLVMSDFFKRLFRPDAADGDCLWVLRLSTIAWGAFGTLMALALVRVTESALDIWWLLSGVLGAIIVGLFLLGLLAPNANGYLAVVPLIVAMLVVAYMAVSKSSYWPESLKAYESPFHPTLAIVVGPIVMVALGRLLSLGRGRREV